MARFAEGTTTSPEKSQMEISGLLRRYGATGFQYGWEDNRAAVLFKSHNRTVRFVLDLPHPGDDEFAFTPTRLRRKPEAARCLHLAIKAKLEAVETGIATFEDEFLAYTVLPDNTTVGEHLQQQVLEAWAAGGRAPRLIGAS